MNMRPFFPAEKVIDQENIELMSLTRPEKGVQARPILPSTQRGHIGVDLRLIQDVAASRRKVKRGGSILPAGIGVGCIHDQQLRHLLRNSRAGLIHGCQ